MLNFGGAEVGLKATLCCGGSEGNSTIFFPRGLSVLSSPWKLPEACKLCLARISSNRKVEVSLFHLREPTHIFAYRFRDS